jgi:putative cell wall-binding protein
VAAKLQAPLLILGRFYGVWPGAELDRLKPKRLLVVGGPAALSSDVMQGLNSWASQHQAVVDVVAGSDRYETAAMVSAGAFPADTDTVFVATGQDFPDALGAVPAAGTTVGKSPVLLVTRDEIPQPVRTELSRLSPRRIVVLGGPAAVSDAVVAQLGDFASDPVTRVAGSDRYGTSVEVSKQFFQVLPPVPVAFAVNGNRFPDALSVGAYASGQGPILLSDRDCIPQGVLTELNRVGSSFVYLIGGTAVLTERVEQLLACF